MKHKPGTVWSVAGDKFACVACIGHKRGESVGQHVLDRLLIQDHDVPYEVWSVTTPDRPGSDDDRTPVL